MSEEPTTRGWLPPRAPGGQPPPRYESAREEPARDEATAEAPAGAAAATAGERRGWAAPHELDRTSPAPRPTFVRGTAPRNGLALAALVFGVAGMLLLLLTLGLGFLFALPCSVTAWICGAQARTRVNLGETTAGRGQAQAGYLLGVVGVVLGVAAAAGWIAWLLAGGDLEELRQDLERYRDTQSGEAVLQAARALLCR